MLRLIPVAGCAILPLANSPLVRAMAGLARDYRVGVFLVEPLLFHLAMAGVAVNHRLLLLMRLVAV